MQKEAEKALGYRNSRTRGLDLQARILNILDDSCEPRQKSP